MPSLEQIIRPFVIDPTTPPVPYITTANDPPPDLVRLNIGIGGTSLSSLSPNVAPKVPPPPPPPKVPLPTKPPAIQYKTLSSSESVSVTYYMTGVVKEKSSAESGYDPFGKGGTFF
jgi:hypothetical protein